MKTLILLSLLSVLLVSTKSSVITKIEPEPISSSVCPSGYYPCAIIGSSYFCCMNGYFCCIVGNVLGCCRRKESEKLLDFLKGETIDTMEPIEVNINKYVEITESFLETIGVYEAFPKTTSLVEKIYPLYEILEKYLNELKNKTEIMDYALTISDLIKEITPKIKEVIDESQDIPVEIKGKINEFINLINSDGYKEKFIENIRLRYPEVIADIQLAIDNYKSEDYKEYGRNLGLAFKIIFMIE